MSVISLAFTKRNFQSQYVSPDLFIKLLPAPFCMREFFDLCSICIFIELSFLDIFAIMFKVSTHRRSEPIEI
jgi:hypothetical protein